MSKTNKAEFFVYKNSQKSDSYKAIKIGFSWPGFFLTPLWHILNKNILGFICYISIVYILILLFDYSLKVLNPEDWLLFKTMQLSESNNYSFFYANSFQHYFWSHCQEPFNFAVFETKISINSVSKFSSDFLNHQSNPRLNEILLLGFIFSVSLLHLYAANTINKFRVNRIKSNNFCRYNYLHAKNCQDAISKTIDKLQQKQSFPKKTKNKKEIDNNKSQINDKKSPSKSIGNISSPSSIGNISSRSATRDRLRRKRAEASGSDIVDNTYDNLIDSKNDIDEWFYEEDGQSVGPVTIKYLANKILYENLSLSTLIWKEGMSDWIPAKEMDNILKQLKY